MLGKIGSGIAGLAATLLAGAFAAPLLWLAVWTFGDAPWFAQVAGPLLVVAAAAGAWLAVALIDGVAGRTQRRVVVATIAVLGLLRLVATLTAANAMIRRDLPWHCAAVIVMAAVLAWRFRVTDARRA